MRVSLRDRVFLRDLHMQWEKPQPRFGCSSRQSRSGTAPHNEARLRTTRAVKSGGMLDLRTIRTSGAAAQKLLIGGAPARVTRPICSQAANRSV